LDHHDDVLPIDPDLAPTDPAEPRVSPPRPRSQSHLHRARPDVLAAIGLGGMLGAAGRRGMSVWLPTQVGQFPWGTFWTNLAGSFLLGLVLVLILERFPPSRYLRPFVATGVIGAFTTMSTYEVEVTLLLKDGHLLTGLVYGAGSLLAGLGLAYAGIVTGRRLAPHRVAAQP
jgi:CrcB protein